MYDFVDRPVTSLDAGGRFLVWSMRSWVKSLGGSHCPASAIANAFARWKMIGGLQHFHRMMLLLNRDGLEKLRFCSLACNKVSEHEAILLAIVSALAMDRSIQARDTIALLIAEDSVGDLLSEMHALARAMELVSLVPILPDRSRA